MGVILLAIAAVVGYAGWTWVAPPPPTPLTEDPVQLASDETAVPTDVTPAVAQEVEARIRAFRDSMEPELRLASSEVSSLLRYSLASLLPAGVIDPRVRMEGDRIDFSVLVLPDALADMPEMGAIAGLLPDTMPVTVRGALSPFGDNGSMLLIQSIEVRGVPIPPPAFPEILVALGREDARGLPESALLMPVFGRITRAYVEDGELVLVGA